MKKDRRKHDIKSKLVAAICMLLVSSIMMVSSTYAWFTLSTAPEVKGITTAVGANGNLEMALLPNGYTDAAEALKAIGDAQQLTDPTEYNVTWGNLVDLSDTSYGLSNIKLYPSMLNDETTTGLVDGAFLEVPTYGADGRVSGFKGAGLTATYGGGVFGTAGFGVRAVGTSSGMSPREIAFREALAAGNAAANKAAVAASTALSAGGSSLASIAMKKAMNGDAASFTQAEVLALQSAFDALIAEDGALTYAEESLRQYTLAVAILGMEDANYAATLQTIQGKPLSELGTYASANITAAITALNGTKTTVTTASDDIDELLDGSNADSTYSWTQLSPFVAYLADIDGMTLNNQELRYWLEKADDGSYAHINELMGQVSNLFLTISESGIYVEVGNLVGAYNAAVTFTSLEFGGWNLSGLSATMKVDPAVNPSHLVNAKGDANNYTADEFGAGDGSTISEYYGYIIDLGFRTNAADSKLQLQTSGIDRIYSDNESNAATMGAGSTMTFSYSVAEGYTAAQLTKLMESIRIVFFDPTDSNKIVGYARLDSGSVKDADSKLTMDIRMWDVTANVENGVAAGAWAADNAIMPLTQNQAAALSVLVYLDGQNLTNADVGNSDIDGKMNLQFSSSAELKPMEYGDLREGNGETEEETQPVTLNNVTSQTYTIGTAAYSEGKVAILLTAGAAEGDNVVVTIDGTTYDAAVVSTQGALGVAVTAADVTADTVITVEPKT